MPTYEFCHSLEECKHEWEEVLSIKASDPTHCPKCGAEGNIIRLISGGSGKGVVELYGQDLVDKIKSDTQQIKKEMHDSPKKYANMLGEERYHQLQTRLDRRGR